VEDVLFCLRLIFCILFMGIFDLIAMMIPVRDNHAWRGISILVVPSTTKDGIRVGYTTSLHTGSLFGIVEQAIPPIPKVLIHSSCFAVLCFPMSLSTLRNASIKSISYALARIFSYPSTSPARKMSTESKFIQVRVVLPVIVRVER